MISCSTSSNNWMACMVQEGRKWLFQVNFFSFKSAWIFSCAFQLSSTTFPCIFFAWFALCFWEKQRQNIEACTTNTTKQNKSISARKRYRRMFFYLIEKHMQKFRHFWRKKSLTSLLHQAIQLFNITLHRTLMSSTKCLMKKIPLMVMMKTTFKR